jgi:adenosylhomocysteine nucleosidase
MSAPPGFRNVGFVCGLQNEARCLTAAGIEKRIAISGARTARAVEVAQNLLSDGAESLVSIGLAGGLDPRLGPGAVIVAERVIGWQGPFPSGRRRLKLGDLARRPVDEDEDEDEEVVSEPEKTKTEFAVDPDLRSQLLGVLGDKTWSGTVIGVDQAVRSQDEKLGLYANTNALVCDMESHAVAKAAHDSDVPFAVLRIVSDPSNRYIPEAAIAGVTEAGEVSIGRVLRGVAIRPWEMPEMLSLAFDARIAFAALRRVARRSAPLFRAVG